jgi:hypothetical protein
MVSMLGKRLHALFERDPARGLHVACAKIKVTTAHKNLLKWLGGMKRVRQAQQWGGETSAKGITLAHRQDRNRVVSVGSRAAGADAVQAGHGRRQPDGPASNVIDRRRPTGCRSRQAGSPDVSEPWAHPRSTPRSFAGLSRNFTRRRRSGNPHQAWLPLLLSLPVSVWKGHFKNAPTAARV